MKATTNNSVFSHLKIYLAPQAMLHSPASRGKDTNVPSPHFKFLCGARNRTRDQPRVPTRDGDIIHVYWICSKVRTLVKFTSCKEIEPASSPISPMCYPPARLTPPRYHLYISYACPWASRCYMVMQLKGLEDAIGLTVRKGGRRRAGEGEDSEEE